MAKKLFLWLFSVVILEPYYKSPMSEFAMLAYSAISEAVTHLFAAADSFLIICCSVIPAFNDNSNY